MKKLLSSFSDSIKDLRQMVSPQLASLTHTSLQKQGRKIFLLKLILGEVIQIHCHNSWFRYNAQHVRTGMSFIGFPVYEVMAHHVCPFWAVVLNGYLPQCSKGSGSHTEANRNSNAIQEQLFFFNMYLFMAVLGLRYSMQAFSSCCKRGLPSRLHVWASR